MKIKLILFTLFVCAFNYNSFGQNNPIENLTWSHWYEFPRNFFQLNWEEPAQPHDELIGYNIYKNNELYRFQTGTSIYNFWTSIMGVVTNCDGEAFLLQNNFEPYPNGFEIHVTAVYNPEGNESGYLQTVFDEGLLLPTKSFINKKTMVYPNPTNGILNVVNENFEKIIVYDVSGKVVGNFVTNSQIDLSNLSKGLYLVKLFSGKGIFVEKIVIE